MPIVTKEILEEAKQIDLKVVDKHIYESAKACAEIHKPATGKKPEQSAMDSVRVVEYSNRLRDKATK